MNLSIAKREPGEEPGAIELLTLRRATRDIVAISSLPSIWVFQSPSQVADSLVETLFRCLGLEFAYVQFDGPDSKIESAYTKRGFLKQSDLARLATELRARIKSEVQGHISTEILHPLGAGAVAVAVTTVGAHFKNGTVIVGSKRKPFPIDTERLVLNIAANQAGITIQHKWAHDKAERLRLRAEESEQRLREALDLAERERHKLGAVFESSPAFLAVLSGPEFVFEKVNERYYELVGHREIMGKKLVDALPEVRLQASYLELLTHVLKTGETFTGSEMQVVLQRKPGAPLEKRYIDLVYQRIIDEDGKPGIFAHGIDVTEKVLSRKAVENERQNFRNLFRQTPEMVCILRGPDHVFEFVNEAHIKAVGFDATGMAVREANPDSAEVFGILDNVYKTGETAHLYEIPITVNGRLRYFNVTYSARRDEDGNIIGLMILGTEITDQVIARRELEASQARFRDLAESLPILVFISGPNGLPTYYNRRFTDFTGLSLDEARSQGWQSIIHPDEYEATLAAWHKAVETGEPYEYEQRLKRVSDGLFRWHLVRGVPIKDENGQVKEWFGTLTDIHDQFNARREIAETVENMSDAFLYVDKDWKIVRCNRQHELISKMKREDQIGKDFLELFFSKPGDRRTKLWESCHRAMRERVSVYVEDYYEPLQIWTANNVYPQGDGGLAFFFRDITEQKSAENELRKAIEARDTFLGIASHELKTPLTSMKLQSQISQRVLEKQGIAAFTSERLRMLIQNPLVQSERLSRLVDDMLDVSRIASGKLSINFERTDLSSLVKDTVKRFAPQLEIAGCEVSLAIEERIEIEADAFRLEQVLTNLITNAMKYASGKPIKVSLAKTSKEAILSVRDHGPGIAKEKTGRVFERFERLVSADKVSGLGLGLYISKEIVEAHGGEIQVDSDLGQGAEFQVSLPFTHSAAL